MTHYIKSFIAATMDEGKKWMIISGGGRPNMAQAGGKNPAGIPDAIAEVATALEGMLG